MKKKVHKSIGYTTTWLSKNLILHFPNQSSIRAQSNEHGNIPTSIHKILVKNANVIQKESENNANLYIKTTVSAMNIATMYSPYSGIENMSIYNSIIKILEN